MAELSNDDTSWVGTTPVFGFTAVPALMPFLSVINNSIYGEFIRFRFTLSYVGTADLCAFCFDLHVLLDKS
jgi:hypothetical protein